MTSNISCLPPHLQGKRHDDWPWPLSYVPRAWTSFCRGSFARPPRKLWGTTASKFDFPRLGWPFSYPQPIPKPGHWHAAWPPYFALTTSAGWHFRIGARYDDVDLYYTMPSIAFKKIRPGGTHV